MKKAPSLKISGKAAAASTQKLFKEALDVRSRSHSPYSGYKVGAALRTSKGGVFTGCNVENSSFGATICAERTAILKAISESGKIWIDEVVVVTDATPAWPPCGLCRQMLSEFATPKTRVIAANLKGEAHLTYFGDLLPDAFTPRHLKK
jgi:cytidine deaminase